jgi:hypothetical protein
MVPNPTIIEVPQSYHTPTYARDRVHDRRLRNALSAFPTQEIHGAPQSILDDLGIG